MQTNNKLDLGGERIWQYGCLELAQVESMRINS